MNSELVATDGERPVPSGLVCCLRYSNGGMPRPLHLVRKGGRCPRQFFQGQEILVRASHPCKERKDGAPSVVANWAKTRVGTAAMEGSCIYGYALATAKMSSLRHGDAKRSV